MSKRDRRKQKRRQPRRGQNPPSRRSGPEPNVVEIVEYEIVTTPLRVP